MLSTTPEQWRPNATPSPQPVILDSDGQLNIFRLSIYSQWGTSRRHADFNTTHGEYCDLSNFAGELGAQTDPFTHRHANTLADANGTTIGRANACGNRATPGNRSMTVD